MNKIYKLVWSKTKNMYVAVSEYAKSHSKSPSMRSLSRMFVTGVLLSLFTCGVVVPARAAGLPILNNVDGNGYYVYFIGDVTNLGTNVGDVYAVGEGITVDNGTEMTVGEGIIILGNNANVSLNNKVMTSRSSSSAGNPKIEHVVALGDSTVIGEENAVAIGYQAKSTALNSFAAGSNAQALSEGASAFGHNAIVNEDSPFGVAVGYEAKATGEGANAFGDNSTAGAKFSVAFGRETVAAQEASTAIGNAAKAHGLRGVAIGNQSVATAEAGVAIGNVAQAVTPYAVAIGRGTVANGDTNNNVVAIGNMAHVGSATTGYGEATAIGGASGADGFYSTAIGSSTLASNSRATAIGSSAQSFGDSSTSIGYHSSATALNSVAIGSCAQVSSINSVALGADSIADAENVVSVGSSSSTRKIVHVTDGTADNDASTVGQTGSALSISGLTLSIKNANGSVLDSVTLPAGTPYTAGDGLKLDGMEFSAKAGTNVTVDANGISVSGNGTISSANTGLVSGGTAYTELRPTDGNYVHTNSTTAANLLALDAQVKSNKDALDNFDGFADTDLSNISATGHTAIKTDAKSAVNVVGGTNASVVKTDVSGVDTYIVNVSANGAVANNNSGIVTGGTVYTALQQYTKTDASNITNPTDWATVLGTGTVAAGDLNLVTGDAVYNDVHTPADGHYVHSADTAGENIQTLDDNVYLNASAIATQSADITNLKDLSNLTVTGQDVIKELAVDSVTVVGEGNITVTPSGNETSKVYTVSVADDGAVALNDDKLVTGHTVYNAIQSAQASIIGNLDDKANIDLDNISTVGETVIKNNAQAAINVIGGTNTTVAKTDVAGVDTYTVNVDSSGAVVNGDTKIVTGGTVYNALQDMQGDIDTDLAGKANVSLDNVTAAGHSVIKSDAKESINVVAGNYATVAKTNVEGVDTYTVNVATDGVVASGNDKLVTGGTVFNALTNAATTIGNELDNKANLDLDNISDDGVSVIKTNAQRAITVTGGTSAAVVKTSSEGVDTYTVNVDKSGTVTDGDTNLVTGAVVYDALQDIQGDIDTDLAGKANVSLNNLTADGHTVIKSDAKEAITVVSGDYATVNKTTVNGVDTYSVSVDTTGAVAEGNSKLVTGGTVYTSLDSAKTELNSAINDAKSELNNAITTGLATKSNVSFDNINDAAKTVIKTQAKQAVNINGGTYATVVKTDVSGVDTYTVNVDTSGAVAEDDAKLVTGGTVYSALDAAKTELNTTITNGLATKSNVDMNNLTETGTANVSTIARDSIAMTGNTDVTVTPSSSGNVKTFAVAVNKNGAVANGNAGIVTGGTVFNTLQSYTKANASNVGNYYDGSQADKDYNKRNWANAIGTNVIEGGSPYLIISDAVYNEVRTTTDGNYVLSANTAGENLFALDSQMFTNTTAIAEHATNIDQLRNMENITPDGVNQIKEWAASSVAVVGSENISVVPSYDTDGTTFTVSTNANGVVGNGDTGLLDGGMLYDELRPDDGYYVQKSETTAANLTALDTAVNNIDVRVTTNTTDITGLKDLSNISSDGQNVVRNLAKESVKVIAGTHTQVVEGTQGEAKTYTVNVSTDGTVAQGNIGLVSGGQVYEYVQAAIGGGGGGSNVVVVNGDNTTVTSSTDGSGVTTYRVTANVDGVVETANAGIVSGGTVYEAINNHHDDSKSDADLNNITDAGKDVIKSNAKEAVNVVGGTYATVAKTDVSGVDTYTVNVATDGVIAEDNQKLVTGGTVYAAMAQAQMLVDTKINNAKTEVLNTVDTELADKANVSLDNINADGETVIADKAKESINVVAGTSATVNKTDVSGVDTYTVGVDTSGQVVNDDTGVVTGGTVYTALSNAKTEVLNSVAGDLAGKANINFDNISGEGEGVIKALSKQAVQLEDGTHSSIYSYTASNGNKYYQVNVDDSGVVASGNGNLVTGGTVYNALQDKANVDLDNLSQTGIDTIVNLAAGASADPVNVVAGDNVSVTQSTVAGVKTFTVGALADGAVASGNTHLVNGGTVYSAIESAKTDAQVYTDTVAAKTDLSNLDAAGVTEVKDIANSSITLENGTNSSVAVRSDGNHGSIYRVDVVADGVVDDGNQMIVSGGTVYTALETQKTELNTAIQDAKDELNAALEGKANTSMNNLTNAGKAQVRQLAQQSVKVVPGTNTGVTVSVDGTYITYGVDVHANGIIDNENNGILKGSTVYNEVRAANGTYVTRANTAAANINSLDTNLKTLSDRVDTIAGGTDETAVHYDDVNKSIVTMAGAAGTKLTNLQDAEITATSSDAVTGKQLHAVTQDVAAQQTQIINLETSVVDTAATVTALDGRVDALETAVTQHTETINTLQDDVTNLDAKVDTLDGKVDTLDGKVTTLDGKVETLETTVGQNTADISDLGERVDIVENGLTSTQNDLNDFKDTVTEGLAGKAGVDLDNLTAAGKDVIRELAKTEAQDAVQVVDGTNTVVRKNVVAGSNQYSVDVVVDGVIEANNTGIVTGGTVYDAIQNIEVKSPHYVSVHETHRDEETYHNGGATGEDSLAMGVGSKAIGNESLSIGHGNHASGEKSIAVGTANEVSGYRSGAFGDPNVVSGSDSYAIGNDNNVSGDNTFVLGNNVTNASGLNSVVLGAGSDGSQDNVVSVGAAGAERKIVNVADGVVAAGSTDAVNGSQLFDTNQEVAKKANADASNIDVARYIEALGTGDVTEGNTGLVKGGTVYTAIQKIRDTNIVPSADGSVLNLGPGSDAVAVDFTNSNGQGRVLQGVLTNPNDPTSAANVGYVDAVGQNIINGVNNSLQKVDTKINKVGAGAAAMSSLAPLPFDDDQKWNISAAVGTFHNETAGAIGVFYKPQDNVMLNLRGSFGNGENMGGAGVTIGLNKGVAKGLSKVSMAKAMNAQADEIMKQRNVITDQQQRLDAQEREIQELKRMFQEMKETSK